jgi:methylated-DNA-[protein]-cysteine S-methyltransferase
MTTWWTITPSPVGPLLLVGDGRALQGLYTGGHPEQVGEGWVEDDVPLQEAVDQLDAYWAGARVEFDLALDPVGTPFQREVWRALRAIRCGSTLSYGELARRIRHPSAVRAVGLANGQNPIGIVVPCHRVIGADGTLTGYGGGIERKRWLLAHERALPALELPFMPPHGS